MQDLGIDLRLAVNYLPACACALQSVALSFVLCGLHSMMLVPAFVPVCFALVVERSQPRTLRIFDGSAVLFSIFASHCVLAIQEFSGGGLHLWPWLYVFFSVEWPFTAMYFLLRPPNHRDYLRLCFLFACARASACAFLARAEYSEHRLVRVGRDLAFAALCLVWTYAVGLYRRKLSRDPSESGTHFAVYFWPVLYAHAYAAATCAFVALAVILVQVRQESESSTSSPRLCLAPQQQAPQQAQEPPSPRPAPAPLQAQAQAVFETLADDDEEILRQLVSARLSAV